MISLINIINSSILQHIISSFPDKYVTLSLIYFIFNCCNNSYKQIHVCLIYIILLVYFWSLKCAVNTRVGVEWEQPLLTKCPNGYAPHTASDSKVLTLPSRGGTVSTNGERRKARHWRSNQLLWTDGDHQLKRQFI